MDAFVSNMYTDSFCRKQVDVTASLREGNYYGWVNNPEAGIRACVRGGEFNIGQDGEKQFCLVFPVRMNTERNSLDVNEDPPRQCLDAKIETISDLTSHMVQKTKRMSPPTATI